MHKNQQKGQRIKLRHYLITLKKMKTSPTGKKQEEKLEDQFRMSNTKAIAENRDKRGCKLSEK